MDGERKNMQRDIYRLVELGIHTALLSTAGRISNEKETNRLLFL